MNHLDKEFPLEKGKTISSKVRKFTGAFALSAMVLLSGCDSEIPTVNVDKYEKGEAVLVHEENGVKFFAVNIDGSRYYYAEGSILDKNRGIGELKTKSGENSVYKVSWKSSAITENSVDLVDNPKYRTLRDTYIVGKTIFHRDVCQLKVKE